jgi:hypothetical protein
MKSGVGIEKTDAVLLPGFHPGYNTHRRAREA